MVRRRSRLRRSDGPRGGGSFEQFAEWLVANRRELKRFRDDKPGARAWSLAIIISTWIEPAVSTSFDPPITHR
jgi:hypothetical protein